MRRLAAARSGVVGERRLLLGLHLRDPLDEVLVADLGALPAQRTQALSVSTSGLAAAKRQQSASGQQAAAHRESMNAICAAGARTAAERPATTAAPLKAGAWKGSRRYIICAGHRGPTGGQAGRSVPDFCLHASALRALSEEGLGHGIPRRCWICG